MEHKLSEKWIKASIAGTIWAASEIVLGSFLHNLKVPFSGNILTAIGLIILISVSYMWTDRGLFWRAGLICALMKTMSPSAVIFGPMVAIFTESLLLELSTRLLGRTLAGFVLGSVLAMSWNLLQKILNYIIFYGASIIGIYTDLLKFAQKQLSIKSDIVWLPVIFLLVLYALFGLFAAVIGVRVGRKIVAEPLSQPLPEPGKEATVNRKKTDDFRYSVVWLLINICFIAGAFILLGTTGWMVWASVIILMVITWSLRYKRALRQLSKPGFWIFFVLVTLLTAFLFSVGKKGEYALISGLITGIQMNFRAVLMIVGFSVLGTELYNPVIRNFFLRTSFRNLPLALELSAESLPYFIACIPDFRTTMKDPVSIFHRVLSHADARLAELTGERRRDGRIYIVTGRIRGGKTTFTSELISRLRAEGIEAGGIMSVRINGSEETTGYDIMDLETGARKEFLRTEGEIQGDRIGRFTISSEGLEEGRKILCSLVEKKKQLVVIDEVGMLELRDGGWAECISRLVQKQDQELLFSVRDLFVEDIIRKWDLRAVTIFDISVVSAAEAAGIIAAKVRDAGESS